ncbi:winged helix-turn-helix domain-containing protein [Pantoea anthophila]|uniref:winged helix-turn-helix domain-containing protein n=1 Tax=Pantoea anthophila TaxID=470931 RepID=UPI003520AD80
MIYIIDDQIAYNSDDCTLSHIPTQDSLSLSISAGRLFEQLLNSDGEILARDTLLTEVWDKYGLRGSNSNLNQYLSILRRALAAYGCQNLIITLPKIGIRLNTEIKIVREPAPALAMSGSEGEAAARIDAEELRNAFSALPASAVPQVKRMGINRMRSALIILTVLIAAFIFYILMFRVHQTSELSVMKLEGGCEAVLLKGLDVSERQSINRQIVEILKENHQSCTAGRRFYFDKNTSFTTTNFGRTILSACNLDNRGHIISCDNFYYLDWRMY